MCRYSSNVTHVWRGGGAGGEKGARACVRGGRGPGGGPTSASARADRTRADARHSRDNAAPRSRPVRRRQLTPRSRASRDTRTNRTRVRPPSSSPARATDL